MDNPNEEYLKQVKAKLLCISQQRLQLKKEQLLLVDILKMHGIIWTQDGDVSEFVDESKFVDEPKRETPTGLPPRQEASAKDNRVKPERSLHKQIIDYALEAIEEKEAAVSIPEIYEHINGEIKCTKQQLSMELSNEIMSTKGSRLRRVMRGLYHKALVSGKVVENDRTPAEMEEVMKKARDNAERIRT
jgi:hypothetical protein